MKIRYLDAAQIELDEALVKRFPYGVLFGYDAADELIVIVAIAHLHRKPLYWLNLNRQSF